MTRDMEGPLWVPPRTEVTPGIPDPGAGNEFTDLEQSMYELGVVEGRAAMDLEWRKALGLPEE